jgi:hypothetical protein
MVFQYLDTDSEYTFNKAVGVTSQYIDFTGTSFKTANVNQRINVPLRYGAHQLKSATVATASALTDTSINLSNVSNAINNWNGRYDSGAKGEMMVIVDTNGLWHRYMISDVTGTVVSVVKGKYDGQDGYLNYEFSVGDKVFFPMTAGNSYMIILYLEKAGGAPASTFTLYADGVNTYTGYRSYYSNTGWDNLALEGGTLYFEIYSNPYEWAIDTLFMAAHDSNLLIGMEFGMDRVDNYFRNVGSIMQNSEMPYNASSYGIDLNKCNRNNKFRWGDAMRVSMLSNAATKYLLNAGVNYNPFPQTLLYSNPGGKQ